MPRANIRDILRAQAAALQRVGGKSQADMLTAIAEQLAARGPLDSAVDKSVQIRKGPRKSESAGQALVLLDDMRAVLTIAAKKDVLADLGRLASFLERHRDMALLDLLKASTEPLNHDKLVADTAKRLRDLLGQDGFGPLLRDIVKNKSVRPADMVAIAAAMDSELPAKTSKKKTAERLLSRHKSLATFKAKQRAMPGRSAA